MATEVKTYGPYDRFGFPQKDLSQIKEAKTDQNFVYRCPYCGEEVPEIYGDDEYIIDGEKYPQYYNEDILCCADVGRHDWDELYKCKNCLNLYVLRNGCL